MTNENYATQDTKASNGSALVHLFKALVEQNERYINLIGKIEKIGHKLKDTNVPEKALVAERQKPCGALDEFGEQIERFRMNNGRLEETVMKLDSLI